MVKYLGSTGISYSYWSYNPNSGDTGGLIKDDWRTPETTKLDALKPLLTAASAPVQTPPAVVIPEILTASIPTITGTNKVGYTLTANPGTWTTGTTLTYQWYRSGLPIKGAASKSYKLVSADRYSTIKVRVVGSKTGYSTLAKYSPPTVRISS